MLQTLATHWPILALGLICAGLTVAALRQMLQGEKARRRPADDWREWEDYRPRAKDIYEAQE